MNQQLMVDKMHHFRWLVAFAAMALAACGGGNTTSDFASTASSSSAGSASVASVIVSSSTATIPADSSASASLSALVLDANRAAIKGVTVTFSASAGSLVVTQGTTDATGLATATVTASGAATGTKISVTATAGSTTGSTSVTVAANQQTITVTTSAPQIPSDSSKSATITALVRGPNNQALPGVNVQFQATSGGLTITQAITDASGRALATLSAFGDPTNRRITVTATAGGSSATVPVDVTGSKLLLTGPANLVLANQGTYTVALTDSGNNGIANTSVALTSSANNTLSAPSVTTDGTGQKTFQMTAVNSGNDTLTASALGLVAQQPVAVSSQNFAFTAPAPNTTLNVALGTPATVTVHWTNAGAAVAGQPVTFSTTRGTLSSGSAMTDASGNASVTVSSTTAGPGIITASATGVTAQGTVNFIATNPASIAVQASPATVPTQGQSTITAVVRDAQNNLVQGQTVNFTLTDVSGGALSVASAVTNSQGVAQTTYTASGTTSAKNGVQIAATVQGTAVTGSATLTVGGQTIFLALGTGNTITAENDAQYSITYAVQAIDAAGNGVNNVQVTLTATSLSYIKGSRAWNGTVWAVVNSVTLGAQQPVCLSEDVNGNGILDPGEDYNGNGKLDPGLVAFVTPGSVTTANGGSALVKVFYPKDHANYVNVRLTASATVQGTQTSTNSDFNLPALADDVNTQSKAPPGPVSPYGTANNCSNPN